MAEKTIRVLLIDDNHAQVRLIERCLARRGFAVFCTQSIQEGLAVLGKEHIDVIVSDYNLQGENGLDFLKVMNTQSVKTPTIILTGSGNEETAVKAIKEGAGDYVIKDIDGNFLELLPTVIERVIDKCKLETLAETVEEEIIRTNAMLNSIQDSITSGILVVGMNQQVINYNSRFLEIWGIPEEIIMKGDDDFLLEHVSNQIVDFDEFLRQVKQLYENPEMVRLNDVIRLKSGRILSRNTRPVRLGSGEIIGRVWDFQDITETRRHMEELQLSSNIVENLLEGILVTDDKGIICTVNPAFTLITGFTREEAIGRKPNILRSGHHETEFYKNMWNDLQTEGHWQGEILNRRKDGEVYPQWLTISAIKNDEGKTTQYASIFYDISELRKNQEALQHQAYHDALTGLPNRQLFLDRLDIALSHAKRKKTELAVLFLDLDGFKKVNDSMGHAAGDILLRNVAAKLIECVRTEDTVARLGGDEFTILLSEIDFELNPAEVARRIIDAVSQPFEIKGKVIYIGVSIGISVFPHDGLDSATMMKNADIAMYGIKQSGKNNYRMFTADMNLKADRRLELEHLLRKSIEEKKLMAFFQPKVSLKTGRITGMEALMRLQSNSGVFVEPTEFIPLAEEGGMIVCLDEWMLQEASGFAKKMQEISMNDLSLSINIAINLSTRDIERVDIVQMILGCVEKAGLRSEQVELEVTETSIIRDVHRAREVLSQLREAGFNVALDDFGTGYSSFNYLAKLPINILKIDRTFILDVETNPNTRAITKALTVMAHELDIKVIAEGVETREQLEFLRNIGCDEMQGFLFSKAVTKDDFEKMLRNNQALDLS